MADPTNPADPTQTTTPNINPVDPAVIQSYYNLNLETAKSEQNMTSLGLVFGTANTALKMLSDSFTMAGVKLENIGNLTSQDATKFGLLTTAVVGATKSFEAFSGVDVKSLSLFNDQFDQVYETLTRKGTALGALKTAMDQTSNMLIRMGRSAEEVNAVVKEGPRALADYAKNVLMSADNARKLQNAFVQLSIQAGNSNMLFEGISDTIKGVGSDLGNLNNVTAKYNDVMTQSMQATGITNRETMAQYAMALTKLPGGIKEVMGTMELGGKRTSLLTATIQYATGAGRDFGQVVDDMNKVMRQFGAQGDTALKFAASLTDVANTLGAQFEDVRTALMHSADAFKFFVNGGTNVRGMTEGMTKAMNDYVGSLKSVGVPVQNALEMFRNYTEQVKNMNQAQQSFISGMTGGPGGLMGGFQIESLITKDPALLQRKVAETIKRMTGPIVTHEQAESSQTAAAQYTRQIQILQQGPLGGMARTRAEAENLLEAMRRGTAVKPTKAPEEALKDAVDKGTKFEQLSYTELTRINTNIARMAGQAEAANLTTLQRTLAARTGARGGSDTEGRGINVQNQEMLREAQRRGVDTSHPLPVSERMFKELGSLVESLPMSISSSVKTFGENVSGKGSESQKAAYERLIKTLDDWKAQAASMPKDQREQVERTIGLIKRSADNQINTAVSSTTGLFKLPTTGTASGTTATTGATPTGVTGRTGAALPSPPPGDFRSAHRQVAAAVPTGTGNTTGATAPGNRATPGGTGAANNQPVPVTLAPGTTLTVNFNGTCPHCGERIQQNQHAKTNSAPSTA